MATTTIQSTTKPFAILLLTAFCVSCQGSPTLPRPSDPVERVKLPTELVTVTGSVTAGGRPVADAEVVAFHESGGITGPSYRAVTGQDGRFRVPDVPVGVVRFYPYKSTHLNPCMTSSVVAQGTEVHLELVMKPAVRPAHFEPQTLTGLVVDSNQKPIPGASVHFNVDYWGWDYSSGLHTATDKDGRYFFCGLFPDVLAEGMLSIGAQGFQGYRSWDGIDPIPVGYGEFAFDVQLQAQR
jgi:hypothetical protein